ncbi:MAG: vWA domain-containing protein [Methylocystaceae bacterium]
MFTDFFYLMRIMGLKVSLNEWMSLIDALDQGLCGASLTEFYHLCRAILVKTEADYDKFDMAFAQYFYGIETPEGLPEQIWEWLDKELPLREFDKELFKNQRQLELEELKKMLEERLKEQTEEHHGGNYWVGTGGTSPFGHSGYHPGGIRIGGESRNLSAVKVAEERRFRDFRTDETLDIRQFQMAFRKLRQFSSRIEGAKTELDLDETVKETCDNAGFLKLVWDRPRTNTLKVLLLMDSGGSMRPYSRICSQLFQAAHNSNHFKDLKTYYFHNCFYDYLYEDPACLTSRSADTQFVMNNLDPEYRVIIVGDASMGSYELTQPGGCIEYGVYNEKPGLWWLRSLSNRYSHVVWLNPIPQRHWDYTDGWWSINKIKEIFPMYELTVEGLDASIKKLKVAK